MLTALIAHSFHNVTELARRPWSIPLKYLRSTEEKCQHAIAASDLGILYGIGGGGAAQVHQVYYNASKSALDHYEKELIQTLKNAKSMLSVNQPPVPIAVVIFSPLSSSTMETVLKLVDCVIKNYLPIRSDEWGEKMPTLLQTPFKNTIFLDLDTYICKNFIPETKDRILKHFELAMASENAVTQPLTEDQFLGEIHHLNSGVMMYKKTRCVWENLVNTYFMHRHGGDQYYLSLQQLTRNSCHWTQLPAEFNLRLNRDDRIALLTNEVRIVHGRLLYPVGALQEQVPVYISLKKKFANVCAFVNNITTRRIVTFKGNQPRILSEDEFLRI
jgi:hypothetical protein